ncbi:MAG: hypothetical protein FWE32_09945 [Oscillospiraceae bacterium]|nr:hypothetical protein [Oscillospiraceae bacterium]
MTNQEIAEQLKQLAEQMAGMEERLNARIDAMAANGKSAELDFDDNRNVDQKYEYNALKIQMVTSQYKRVEDNFGGFCDLGIDFAEVRQKLARLKEEIAKGDRSLNSVNDIHHRLNLVEYEIQDMTSKIQNEFNERMNRLYNYSEVSFDERELSRQIIRLENRI